MRRDRGIDYSRVRGGGLDEGLFAFLIEFVVILDALISYAC